MVVKAKVLIIFFILKSKFEIVYKSFPSLK